MAIGLVGSAFTGQVGSWYAVYIDFKVAVSRGRIRAMVGVRAMVKVRRRCALRKIRDTA